MSQCNVERVIGHLVTDEGFRRRYAGDPAAALEEMRAAGVELNAIELSALAAIDPELVAEFADRIDPRILKACVRGAMS